MKNKLQVPEEQMTVSRQNRRNLKTMLIITAFISLGAVINALMEHGFNFAPVINEFTIGLLFGFAISASEIYFFERKMRRARFVTLLAVRTLFYLALCTLIIITVAASRVGFEGNLSYYYVFSHEDLISYIKSPEFTELLIYSIVLSFFVNFVRQINRFLGQNVLLNYISGKYQPPVEEELIFMFLDLNSSTTIAEKLGVKRNHEFLNDFFHEMTDAILECKGKIYQYVGDEVVLTWSINDGKSDLNCIRCFFLIQEKINESKNHFLRNYDVFPEFKAGLHAGAVIAGEIGDIKKDIVYHGDTVNTTARIEAECNKYGKKFLASDDVLKILQLNSIYKAVSLGSIKLRGRKSETRMFSIEDNNEPVKTV
ncbi:MAG: adenylate/guanylate cyclase domain-containing protein [bacterium]|nr:adenylate/guanylate cyclase domain-containing protein [bacterium]